MTTFPLHILFDSYAYIKRSLCVHIYTYMYTHIHTHIQSDKVHILSNMPVSGQISWDSVRLLLAVPARLLHIYHTCLKGAVLIPARADCIDESDFALYTNAGPVCSH